MKKVMLILMLGVFTMSTSSFKVSEIDEFDQDCEQYASDSVDAENEVFGPNSFWGNVAAFVFYYDLCTDVNEEGGEALEPVFVP